MIELVAMCLSYLIGSIPSGILAGRLKGIDIRKHGSGNIGATNVSRVLGKAPGVIVLLVDVLKGWFPVAFLAPQTAQWGAAMPVDVLKIELGVAAVAGHIWNPWFQFQGGKGVATGLGVLFALDWRVGLIAVAVFAIVVTKSRFVSMASICAAMVCPFALAVLRKPSLWVFGAIGISLAIIWRHRPNILRLIHREEHRIGS